MDDGGFVVGGITFDWVKSLGPVGFDDIGASVVVWVVSIIGDPHDAGGLAIGDIVIGGKVGLGVYGGCVEGSSVGFVYVCWLWYEQMRFRFENLIHMIQ